VGGRCYQPDGIDGLGKVGVTPDGALVDAKLRKETDQFAGTFLTARKARYAGAKFFLRGRTWPL